MNRIITYLQRIGNPLPKKIMGRWNISYSKDKINTKIDLANSDNCYTSYTSYTTYDYTTNHTDDTDDTVNVEYVIMTSY